MHTRFPLVLLLPLALVAGLVACNTKASQCSRLIEAVNHHTEQLAEGIAELAELRTKPEVVGQFEQVVDAAHSEIAVLEFADETVARFAKDYLGLLTEAKALGTALGQAEDQGEAKAKHIADWEDQIVAAVNAYCEVR